MISLYRKYRPKNFSEIEGQEIVVKSLTTSLAKGLVSHGYLFAGARGLGKTTIARIFAKALNCQRVNYQPLKEGEKIDWQKEIKKENYEPCNQCQFCQEIDREQSLNLIEMDAASNRGIEEIRNLKESVNFPPAKGKYKIYLLDEAHMLTKEAANALLKTLEEPPSYIVFILATTEPEKLPATILSRVQKFDFRRLSNSQIVSRLKKIIQAEKIKIEERILEKIALLAEGSMRDAESLLEQIISLGQKEIKEEILETYWGIIPLNKIDNFLNFLIENKTKEAIEWLEERYNQGQNLNWFLTSFLNYLRWLYLYRLNPQWKIFANFSNDDLKLIEKTVKKISQEEINNLIKIFFEVQQKMKYSPLPTLPIEIGIIEASDIFHKRDL
ncbi:DNA polymerase III subunit gamma/tau [bacterium]|nr:DNA polymerase III subunit gamma/tau [bacterium]